MQFTPTELPGVFVIKTNVFEDTRGLFIKTFNFEVFKENGIDITFKESFYSISQKNVIRGMHFHLPPKEHAKLVYVSKGSITDIVLDLRKNSPTYKKYITIELSEENRDLVFIPTGCAHGFIAHEDNTCTVYLQTGGHSKEHDAGIRIDSFDLSINLDDYIISERDLSFQSLEEFQSPF